MASSGSADAGCPAAFRLPLQILSARRRCCAGLAAARPSFRRSALPGCECKGVCEVSA